MLFHCILISCLAETVISQHPVSGVRNAAEPRAPGSAFLQAGVFQHSAVEDLRERAVHLRDELAGLPADDLGVKGAEEAAPTVSSDKMRVQVSLLHKDGATQQTGDQDSSSKQDTREDEIVVAVGMGKPKPNVLYRPSRGTGKPDVIKFGMFAKTFYGVNVKANTFVIDLVISLKWMDKRVVDLIPAGLESLTLSKKESELKIWLPGMVVANRDMRKYDLISTGVTINRKGEVIKVERATVVVKNVYMLENFPFDRQNLITKISSHKYMVNEVVLEPDSEGGGVREGLMDGEAYTFVDVKGTAMEDISGAAKKSRGLLTITVDRNADKYVNNHLIPAALIIAISWAVFWFPYTAPFTTPRLKMSILALVNFTMLMLKSGDALPDGAPFNWNDSINHCVLTCMFATVVLNILAESCWHTLKCEDLAKQINSECKVFLPFLSIVSLVLMLSAAGHDGWMSLATASMVTNGFLALALASYLALVISRIKSEMAAKVGKAQKEHEEHCHEGWPAEELAAKIKSGQVKA